MVFDIKRFALHDGPGTRTTVFLKGCPLRCWWCHNPEGQSGRPEIMFQKNRCDNCGECLRACPEDALAFGDEGLLVNHERCTLCGACAEACPREALVLCGREMTVAEVLAEIEKDSLFYDESRGGVTFSGGEPLAQPEFLESLLRACRKEEIHTSLDTTGFGPWEVLERVAPLVDLFLYDLKLMDDRQHQRFTGVSNGPILENLRALSSRGSRIVIRLPLIPGINDDPENIRRTGEFLASLARHHPVDILPYHRAGIGKYAKLSRAYCLPEVEPPAPERSAQAAQILAGFGLEVTIGGEAYGRQRES
ncbi:MAG: glycyl-radical enzyme activating protein [Candidatus Acetothermia bacterium]|nr:glycyl-radical enzyme activating protein [Candidatus Acetothermia bacterium]MDH7505462.1 glycyl-radical enzyme activating protein [Candidatus Acetothermia bacterium]